MVLSTISIDSITPRGGATGTSITLAGSGFGTSQGTIIFDPLNEARSVTSITTWAPTQVVFVIPTLSLSNQFYDVLLSINGGADSIAFKLWIPDVADPPSVPGYQFPNLEAGPNENDDVPDEFNAVDFNRLLDRVLSGGGGGGGLDGALIYGNVGGADPSFAGIAWDQGAALDPILVWNPTDTRFELGRFDTVNGTTPPSATLSTFSDLRVNGLSLAAGHSWSNLAAGNAPRGHLLAVAGDAAYGDLSGDGGSWQITAGSAAGASGGDGGNILMTPGSADGAGVVGRLQFNGEGMFPSDEALTWASGSNISTDQPDTYLERGAAGTLDINASAGGGGNGTLRVGTVTMQDGSVNSAGLAAAGIALIAADGSSAAGKVAQLLGGAGDVGFAGGAANVGAGASSGMQGANVQLWPGSGSSNGAIVFYESEAASQQVAWTVVGAGVVALSTSAAPAGGSGDGTLRVGTVTRDSAGVSITTTTSGDITINAAGDNLLPGAGISSTRIGVGAAATNQYAIAIGEGATASQYAGIAIGFNADAGTGFNGSRMIAIGEGAVATGLNSTVIGYIALDRDNDSAAVFGTNAEVNGIAATAVGVNAIANSLGVCVGANATTGTTGNYSTAVGYFAKTASQGTALGGAADSSGATGAIAIGYDTRTFANYAIAIGYDSENTVANTCVIGSKATNGAITELVVGAGREKSAPSAELLFTTTGGSGTNIHATDLVLQSGLSTGNAAVTSVVIRTPTVGTTGTTPQSAADRVTINSSGLTVNSGFLTYDQRRASVAWDELTGEKALTDAVATSIATLPIAQEAGAGGTWKVIIYAIDGTDVQVAALDMRWAVGNKAGTFTTNLSGDSGATASVDTAAGTFTITPTLAEGAADTLEFRINCDTSLTTTTFVARYEITSSLAGLVAG